MGRKIDVGKLVGRIRAARIRLNHLRYRVPMDKWPSIQYHYDGLRYAQEGLTETKDPAKAVERWGVAAEEMLDKEMKFEKKLKKTI